MRKGRDGEKKKREKKKTGKKREKKENTDENSGHYVIASSRPPKCRPLKRCTLVPIMMFIVATNVVVSRTPKPRLTGTPTARDNNNQLKLRLT